MTLAAASLRASVKNLVGENVRQMMLANNDFDVDADFARASENFEHAADGGERRPWDSA